MLISAPLTYPRRGHSIETQYHSCLVDRITTVYNHGRALHEARFTAGQEQNAVCHFLGASHAAHGRDTHRRSEDFSVGLSHGRIDHTWTDAVHADEVFGVLGLDGVSLCSCGVAVTVSWEAPLTSIASHFVMLITAAFEPQYAAGCLQLAL
jgi:hypothetical protein